MKNWLLKNVLRKQNLPPTCGAYLRFRQAPGRGAQTFGEFIFSSADVEDVLIAHLAENPHLAVHQDGAILRWVQQRDVNAIAAVCVPEAWWRFQYAAKMLLEDGRGVVHCSKCNSKVSHDQFPRAENLSRGNWVFSTFKCAEGHTLLDVETVHYCVRKIGAEGV